MRISTNTAVVAITLNFGCLTARCQAVSPGGRWEASKCDRSRARARGLFAVSRVCEGHGLRELTPAGRRFAGRGRSDRKTRPQANLVAQYLPRQLALADPRF